MGKMEQSIKSEIIRLARKEMRATCLPLAREVRHLKRLVSELRRTVRPLKTLGAELETRRAAELSKLQAPPEEVRGSRLSALLIRKLRTRLDLSQGGLAVLVGVSGAAVASWEQDKSRPSGHNKEALVALRKLGRRDVKKLLADKKPQPGPKTRRRKAGKGRRRRPHA
jgi:DNA-binding transcriptional regulator YiaG